MSRGRITKIDLLSRVYRWKTGIYENTHRCDLSNEMKSGYEEALNDILEALKEFSE